MKRLISLIVIAIMAMFLAGCNFEYHEYRRPGPVVITRPVPRPYPPRHRPYRCPPPHRRPRRGRYWH